MGFQKKYMYIQKPNKIIDSSKDTNRVSTFFNMMHITLQIPKVGKMFMGIVSLAIMFLTITGLYLWLINRKKRVKSRKSFAFRWHKDISLILLPYIFLFSLSGALLGVMIFPGSMPFAFSAVENEKPNVKKIVRPLLMSKECKSKKKWSRSFNEESKYSL